jgi:hypothetical protein
MKVHPGGLHATFGGMCWTLPSQQGGEIAWKARYGAPTKEQMLTLAGMYECYRELVLMPEKRRREIVRQLRRALKLASANSAGAEPK